MEEPSNKECPMCGAFMRLSPREVQERVPGTIVTRLARFEEWSCPDCDYFEERNEDEETAG